MNNLLNYVLIGFMCLLGSNSVLAQNIYAVNNNSDQLVTLDPTTLLPVGVSVSMTQDGTPILGCNGLAVHPVCGEIYIIYKMSGVVGRLLGIVNPTSGEINQIGNTGDKVAGICFGDAEHLYAITGDGADVPSSLYKVNMTTAVMTLFVTYGSGDDGECIGFSPDDGKIYHWSGIDDIIMESTDTLTGVTTDIAISGFIYSEVFGAMYNGAGSFLLSDIDGVFINMDVSGSATLAAEVVDDYKGLGLPVTPPDFDATILTEDPVPFCPGDSALFTASVGESYQWYLDDFAIAGATSSTYEVGAVGELSAFIESPDGCMIQSNIETISLLTSPIVTLLPGDAGICLGDSVLFIGSSGGTSQWYKDGVIIPGADNDSIYVSTEGIYNMVKTNTSGCSDSADVGIILFVGTYPIVTLLPATDTIFCPGDSVMLSGSTGGTLQWYKKRYYYTWCR